MPSEKVPPTERSVKALAVDRPTIDPIAADNPAANRSGQVIALPSAAEPLGAGRIIILSLAIFWSVAVGFLLTRRLGGWLLLERMRRTAVPLQGPPLEMFQACRTRIGLRRQAILASHAMVRSPVTLGLRRPMILVPPSWMELPELAQRASLLHELAHLARYDDWTALLLEIVRTVFFFHPLVHWLLRRIEYERELLCDEAAVAQGIDPREYASVLLEFSRQPGRLRAGFVGPAYLLGFGHSRSVKARINRLLEANMNRWMSPLPAGRAMALGVIALGSALALGSFGVRAIEPQTKESETAPPGRTAAQLGGQSNEDFAHGTGQQSGTATKIAANAEDKKKSLSYGGKSFAEWKAILNNDLKPEVRVEAIKALSAFGANGYGKEAAAAIIELMRGYDIQRLDREDIGVREAAYSAFRKIGSEGVLALIDELKHGKINGRRFAISALPYAGGPTGATPASVVPKAAAPAVLEAFKDEDSYIRVQAIHYVDILGVDPKQLVPALTEALKDPDPNIRRSATYKLEKMGQSAKPAVPALLAALKDNNEDVRYYAVLALLKSGIKLPEVLPGIVVGLKDQKHVHSQSLNTWKR